MNGSIDRVSASAAVPHRCECRSRREFLEHVPHAVAAALVATSSVPGAALALPIVFGRGEAAGPNEKAYAIPAADGVTIDRDSQVILVRSQQRMIAFNLACPHENTALRWREQDGRFQCPRHESKYQPDGRFVAGRATRNMDRLRIRRDGSRVIIDLSKLLRSDLQPAEWAAAAVAL